MERYARRDKARVVRDSLNKTIAGSRQLLDQGRKLLKRAKELRDKR